VRLCGRRFSIPDRLVTRSARHHGIYWAIMIMTRRLAWVPGTRSVGGTGGVNTADGAEAILKYGP
jgi:hypothetical protein